ncbi:hypothetical protein AnigIFM62618_002218 [Aspergillus niger]|nr:hypothetical protein AnigIFM62618_002218 [Aspergillus niger]
MVRHSYKRRASIPEFQNVAIRPTTTNLTITIIILQQPINHSSRANMVSSSSTSMPSTRTITTPSPIDDEDVEVVDTPSTSSTSSSSPSSIRLTAAGKCKAELKSGNIGLECPCNRGVFLLSHTNDIGDKCVDEKAFSSPFLFPLYLYNPHPHPISTNNNNNIVEEPPTPRHTTLTKLMNLMDLYPLLYVRGIPDSGKGTVNQFRRDNFMLMTREQEAHSFFLPVDKPLEEFDSEEDLLTQFVNSFNRLCKEPRFFFLVLYFLTLSAFMGVRFLELVVLPYLPAPGKGMRGLR